MLLIAIPTFVLVIYVTFIIKAVIHNNGSYGNSYLADLYQLHVLAALIFTLAVFFILLAVGHNLSPDDNLTLATSTEDITSVKYYVDVNLYEDQPEESQKEQKDPNQNYFTLNGYIVNYALDGKKYALAFSEEQIKFIDSESTKYEKYYQCYKPNLFKLTKTCEFAKVVLHYDQEKIGTLP